MSGKKGDKKQNKKKNQKQNSKQNSKQKQKQQAKQPPHKKIKNATQSTTTQTSKETSPSYYTIIAVFVAIVSFYLVFEFRNNSSTPAQNINYNFFGSSDPFFTLANEFEIELNGIKLDSNKNGIRGIIATKDINKGDIIMSIPSELMIGPSSKAMRSIINEHPNIQEGLRRELLAVHMAYDVAFTTKEFENDAFWKLYYSYFLSNININMNQDEDYNNYGLSFTFYSPKTNLTKYIKKLVPMQMKMINFRKQSLIDVWNSHTTHSTQQEEDINNDDMIMNITHLETLETVKIIKYKKYFEIFLTHMFGSGAQGTPYFVPFIDMINHCEEHLTNVKISSSNKKTKVLAKKDINKYDEILISYKDANNADLLIDYGFLLNLNIYDQAFSTYYKYSKMIKKLVKKYDLSQHDIMLNQLNFKLRTSSHLLPSLNYIWEYYIGKNNQQLKTFVLENYAFSEDEIKGYILTFVKNLEKQMNKPQQVRKSKQEIEMELIEWQTNIEKQIEYFNDIHSDLIVLEKEYNDNFYIQGLIKLLVNLVKRWEFVRDFVGVIQNGLSQGF